MENRIIKFRGKRIDNGEWVYGSYHRCIGSARFPTVEWEGNKAVEKALAAELNVHWILEYNLPDHQGWEISDTFRKHKVIPESVGQLVLNIGGKEYYEGDIVKAHKKGANFPLNYIIVFNEEELAYKMRWTGRAKEDGFYDEKIGIGGFNTFDAIGNLHDNPELITDKVK